jgi:hypothetical protein
MDLVNHLAHLRARPHRGRLNIHAFLGLSNCADASPQKENADNRNATEKLLHP